MVLWQGLTEGGTAVPVQVTEAGRVVAEGQQGPAGEEGPQGPKGDQGPQGEYGPGDDVDLGSITTSGSIEAEGNIYVSGGADTPGSDNFGLSVTAGGIKVRNNLTAESAYVFESVNASGTKIKLRPDGSATFAGNIDCTKHLSVNVAGQVGSNYAYRVVNGNAEPFRVDGGGNVETAGAITIGTLILASADGSISAAGNAAGITSSGEIYFTSRGTRYKIFVSQGLVQAEPYTREMELRERAEALRKPRTTDSVPED